MNTTAIPVLDDDDDDDETDEDDYELDDCPARHDCTGAGNYLGWCILADDHGGQHQCGRCGNAF